MYSAGVGQWMPQMQKPRLTGRGFCNKKRGEENEKEGSNLYYINARSDIRAIGCLICFVWSYYTDKILTIKVYKY